MRRILAYVILGMAALFLESTWLASWPTQNVRFQLVWIFILFLGFRRPLLEGVVMALLLGFLSDAMGTPFLGLLATTYFVAIVFIKAFMAQMFVETLWARLLWVGILSLAAMALQAGILALVGRSDIVQTVARGAVIIQAVLNMVLAGLLLPLLERCDSALGELTYES